MNIPISWLKQYVDFDCDAAEFADVMTMSGTKVEAVEELGYEIDKVVVGKALEVVKHPDADKLVICQIDIGKPEPIQIVTGATNVVPGAYVPVALDGSTLAGGIKIKKGKLRGQVSNGMMCSIDELGYTIADFPEAQEDAIYVFPEAQPIGADVCPIMELKDEIVEFELTSNRPDCYSVLGIAREVAAAVGKPFKQPEVNVRADSADNGTGTAGDMIAVEIKNPELCPRYTARVVKNAKIGPSPQWMRRRLTKAGLRPINNIVDITNYVMLEYGQPMHAFDIDNIDERKIIVRNAVDGEVFTTLDGEDRILDSSMLVIADCNKAVGIAGVMGGENSKITGHASAILFESANFKGANIRQTAKKLGLRTDASSKYEKGLDPELCLAAINRAVQLVEELGCGEVVKDVVDCYPNKRLPWTVEYSPERINALLGIDITEQEMIGYLKRLEIEAADGVAKIPTFRPDLEMEADLAEEIARLYGYDRIETTMVTGTPTIGRFSYKQQLENMVCDTMTAMGLCEAMTYSFESQKAFNKLRLAEDNPMRQAVTISNPLGEDFSVMRTTPLNGMLTSLGTNYSKRNEEARLFEMAKVYMPKALPLTELPDEMNMLAVGMYGGVDFYDIKGVLEQLFGILGISADYVAEPVAALHPGRCAVVRAGETELGYLGEVHPAVADVYELPRTYVAVLNLDAAFSLAELKREYKPLPKFPGIQRDIALLIDEKVTVREIENVIRERGGKYFEDVRLFDVYRGKQVQEGKKSVAYKIFFRAQERTLTDDEVSRTITRMLDQLQEQLGAALRA